MELKLIRWENPPLRRRQACRSFDAVRCHACADEITLGSAERVGFRDSCHRCGADLHSCCNCAHRDPTAYNECRESSAERVLDKDRANRCDYFVPGEGGVGEGAAAREQTRSELEKLFRK